MPACLCMPQTGRAARARLLTLCVEDPGPAAGRSRALEAAEQRRTQGNIMIVSQLQRPRLAGRRPIWASGLARATARVLFELCFGCGGGLQNRGGHGASGRQSVLQSSCSIQFRRNRPERAQKNMKSLKASISIKISSPGRNWPTPEGHCCPSPALEDHLVVVYKQTSLTR